MYCNKDEDYIINSILFNSITKANEILKKAQETAKNFFIGLPDIKSVYSNQLDKESIMSFLCKLEDILTPSQIKELEPIFLTFIEIISYKSFKQGIRLGIEYKQIVSNSNDENGFNEFEISILNNNH